MSGGYSGAGKAALSTRPDICLPIALIIAYSGSLLCIVYAMHSRLQVNMLNKTMQVVESIGP